MVALALYALVFLLQMLCLLLAASSFASVGLIAPINPHAIRLFYCFFFFFVITNRLKWFLRGVKVGMKVSNSGCYWFGFEFMVYYLIFATSHRI